MPSKSVTADDAIITRIVVRRNHSLSLSGFAGFIAAGFALHLALGVAAALAGWWPIAAFVGGAFVLSAGMVFGVRVASETREVITVGERTVTVEYGRHRPLAWIDLDRYWARVERRGAPSPALLLCSGRTTAVVGRALTESERTLLARRLAELVGPAALGTGASGAAVAL